MNRAGPLHHAPVIHPTGFRHVPVIASVPFRRPPTTHPNTQKVTASSIRKALQRTPALAATFVQKVACTLTDHKDIDSCLHTAWHLSRQTHPSAPKSLEHAPALTLKEYWTHKQALRSALSRLDNYWAPVLLYVASGSQLAVARALPRSLPRLSCVLTAWRAACQFHKSDRIMRKRARAHKLQSFETQLQQALLAERQGLTAVYSLIRRLRPKASKRSIHFRSADGSLLSTSEELAALTAYFRDLYASDTHEPPPWHLPHPICFTETEVLAALKALPGSKALPPGDAPAQLWQLAAGPIAPVLTAQLNRSLAGEEPCLFNKWYESTLVLIPKVGKPPNKPANLRPIALLPAPAKLLAKLAADRLRPFVQQALESIPQFAYLTGRETSDSLDRILSHCAGVRSEIQRSRGRIQFKAVHKGSRFAGSRLKGGLQLSLDLTKAYDRMPRHRLLEALLRIHAPPALVALILHIHDNARIVLEKNGLRDSIVMGQGVRQGCGLSPLLWLAYTVLIFDRLSEYMPVSSTTGFADDFHLAWRFHRTFEFRNACAQLPRVLQDLRDLGMEVSTAKTVVLLALTGPDAPSILRDYTVRNKHGRFLCLRGPAGTVRLPIKTSHVYLGVKISYGHFERLTLQYRLSQAWTAFHRLSSFLKNPRLPLNQRVQLWRACVWSITSYGLTAVGVDKVSANTLTQQVMKQLRLLSRSPAHLTGESNVAPLGMLRASCAARIARCQDSLRHVQPEAVRQWHSVVLSSFTSFSPEIPTSPPAKVSLTEVTQVLKIQCHCPACGQSFGSTHALHVHIGKAHPELQFRKERNTTPKNKRVDDFRKHSVCGRPQCRHCGKKFHGWPAFMGHFSQRACPILYQTHIISATMREECPESIGVSTTTGEVEQAHSLPAQGAFAPGELTVEPAYPPPPTPLFHRPALQALANQGDLKLLAAAMADCQVLAHCPECFQQCTHPSYVSRHAQIHAEVRIYMKLPSEVGLQQKPRLASRAGGAARATSPDLGPTC